MTERQKQFQHELYFQKGFPDFEVGLVSDGYHTFNELYEHRIVIFITLCRLLALKREVLAQNNKVYVPKVWRSKTHSDGSVWDGWFILGIDMSKGSQITYHLPDSKWDDCRFADTLDKAPEFDGHTSEEVLKRLMNL